MKWIIISVLLFFACSGLVMASLEQVGAVASGRAKSVEGRLESILGQGISGVSGGVTSGFLVGSSKPYYLPGDVNGSGDINISDAVFLVSYIFGGGTAPVPLNRGDTNCDGRVNISDAVFLISYIFGGGGAPQNCR